MKKLISLMFVAVMAVTLTACGGGGGGGGTPGRKQPTIAVIKIATLGTPSSSPINGAQAILHLPAGVTVKATQNAPQTDTGVVTSSGADLFLGVYSAATGTVQVYVAKTAGIAVGEFATVNCDIAKGSFPASADFSVSNLSVVDADGNLITGLTATFNATIN